MGVGMGQAFGKKLTINKPVEKKRDNLTND